MEELEMIEILQETDTDILINISQQIAELNLYVQLFVYIISFIVAFMVAWNIWKYIKTLLRSYIKLPI